MNLIDKIDKHVNENWEPWNPSNDEPDNQFKTAITIWKEWERIGKIPTKKQLDAMLKLLTSLKSKVK